jgi:hypothetical protein
MSLECFGQVKSEASPNQLITFARCLREARPVKDRDLPPAAFDQTGMFELPGGNCNGWPLGTQHFVAEATSPTRQIAIR